jgi:hypothetical protein
MKAGKVECENVLEMFTRNVERPGSLKIELEMNTGNEYWK